MATADAGCGHQKPRASGETGNSSARGNRTAYQIGLERGGGLPSCCRENRTGGLASKKRTQKLCNSLVSSFGFRSQWAIDSPGSCGGVGGCKRPQCSHRSPG